ncbi:hypothetical protein ABIE41_004130 [Bosea sp. OAE506]|uniref:hypothetical protein n=1 Tax=Bosea sp. OAE506 TaxID=2663870 RepID=UPI00178B8AD4
MPSTPRKARAAIAAGGAAQALAARMATMQADAGLTIAMRMPILMQGALGDSRGQREAAQAVTEKVTAVLESGFAAGQAGALFWWGLMLSPLGSVDLADAAAKVAHSTLEPFSRRTSANAARLGRSRRRG